MDASHPLIPFPFPCIAVHAPVPIISVLIVRSIIQHTIQDPIHATKCHLKSLHPTNHELSYTHVTHPHIGHNISNPSYIEHILLHTRTPSNTTHPIQLNSMDNAEYWYMTASEGHALKIPMN
eukprot:590210_1